MKWIEVVQNWWNDIALAVDGREETPQGLSRDYVVSNAEVETSVNDTETGDQTLKAFSSDKGMLLTYGYENVTALFGGDEKSHIVLNDVKNALLRTHRGDDFIEINPAVETKDKSSLQIFTHAGNDMVILNSMMNADVYYKINAGPGNDQIISRGRSKEVLDGGEGDDYFEPGLGNDVVLGGPGFDEVQFADKLAAYKIRELANGRVEVSNDSEIKTLVDVEILTFKDSYLHFGQDNNVDDGILFLQASQGSYVFQASYGATREITTERYEILEEILRFFKERYLAQSSKEEQGMAETAPDASSTPEETAEVAEVVPEEADVLAGTAFEKGEKEDLLLEEGQKQLNHVQEATLTIPDMEETPIETPIDIIAIEGLIREGGNKKDYLSGSWESDLIMGGAGRDNLFGWDGDDVLIGGAGNDRIEGGGGDDLIIGGTGKDTAFYWGWADEFVFDLEKGTITDLLDDYGTDTLVSVEKIQFIDATYKITDDGIEKSSTGWNRWFSSDLHVTGEGPGKTEDDNSSYQLHVCCHGKEQQMTIEI
ncbi:hypothetical protein RYZ26_00545 [Terasakiella sp. A23]|uniref:calcium-binding protein n=1 Tax=Terasakiella sp. FCG-A23 TaxID=3080561 RepID=UPI0029532014|nr:hypothetical protein [Terasakiella sp. A23]MDV7338062.1 hypothetical protein [Terasakiella sp. A23]